MKKQIARMPFEKWIADQVKALAPRAKTIRPIGWYFATGDDDDVNVDFNRKIAGYGNWHFTTLSLAEFYGAVSCSFDKDFGIALEFASEMRVSG